MFIVCQNAFCHFVNKVLLLLSPSITRPMGLIDPPRQRSIQEVPSSGQYDKLPTNRFSGETALPIHRVAVCQVGHFGRMKT